jgi:imidazolonepropionase
MMMTLGCIEMHLSPAELLWATTLGGAYALAMADTKGSLLPGYDADMAIWDAKNIDDLAYYFSSQLPVAVFTKGNIVSH